MPRRLSAIFLFVLLALGFSPACKRPAADAPAAPAVPRDAVYPADLVTLVEIPDWAALQKAVQEMLGTLEALSPAYEGLLEGAKTRAGLNILDPAIASQFGLAHGGEAAVLYRRSGATLFLLSVQEPKRVLSALDEEMKKRGSKPVVLEKDARLYAVSPAGPQAEMAMVLVGKRALRWPAPTDGAAALAYLKALRDQKKAVHPFVQADLKALRRAKAQPGQIHILSLADAMDTTLKKLKTQAPIQPTWRATRVSLQMSKRGMIASGDALLDEATRTRVQKAFADAKLPPGHCHARDGAILSWEMPWELGDFEAWKKEMARADQEVRASLGDAVAKSTALPDISQVQSRLAGPALVALRPLAPPGEEARSADPLDWVNLLFVSRPAGDEGKLALLASLDDAKKAGKLFTKNVEGRQVLSVGPRGAADPDFSAVVDPDLFVLGLGEGTGLGDLLSRLAKNPCSETLSPGARLRLNGPALSQYLNVLADWPAADPRLARRQAAILRKVIQLLAPLDNLAFDLNPTPLGLHYRFGIVLGDAAP
jgi:hypothetical protein